MLVSTGSKAREGLDSLLQAGDEAVILKAISDGVIDRIIPGVAACLDCDQGKHRHLEGDVAMHTAKVVANSVRLAKENASLHYDAIDRLAALVHDLGKPLTRKEDPDGTVHFPGHEEKSVERLPEIARRLSLSVGQIEKLFFLVREHGAANDLPKLSRVRQRELVSSTYWLNLAILQHADAISCYYNLDGSSHHPVHRELFLRLRAEFGCCA